MEVNGVNMINQNSLDVECEQVVGLSSLPTTNYFHHSAPYKFSSIEQLQWLFSQHDHLSAVSRDGHPANKSGQHPVERSQQAVEFWPKVLKLLIDIFDR